jgi:uncharacterized protein (TIGR03435 family)
MGILWSPALAGLTLAAASWALVVQATAPVLAQSPKPQATEHRFEVASVKPGLSPYEQGRLAGQGQPVPTARFGIQTQPGGRFLAGSSLKQLIAEAFEVKDYQIEGGPEWLATDYFEITANAGADATPADVKAMLRTLLSERFGLRTRSETRQAPAYVLTVARSDGRLGSRMTPSAPECLQQIEENRQRREGVASASPPRTPEAQAREQSAMREQMKRMMAGDLSSAPRCGSTMMGSRANGASTYVSGGMEIAALVSRLSGELSAPVIDRTGLTGLFDVSLEYLSERSINGRPAGLDPNSTEPLPVPLPGALQQQLGLKIERQIGPMPVVVIEGAERPTPD